MELGLDPLTTNLVVADASRTEKTICLAVTTSLKSYGIPGRARLFEVIQKVKYVNQQRKFKAPNRTFTDVTRFDMLQVIKKYGDMTAIVTSGVSAWGFHYKWPAKSEVVNIRLSFE